MQHVTKARRDVTVVIIEDHVMFAETLSYALELQGIQVLGVGHRAADAARLVGEHRPDVLLLDYILPDGDGVRLASEMVQRIPSTKVVIFTGSGDNRTLVQAVAAGCAGYVTKDQRIEDLAAAVRAARDGETLISPSTLLRLVEHLGGGTPWIGSELTARELEVLQFIAEGLANKQIAQQMTLSLNTVRNHVHSVVSKLGAHSKLGALMIAQREGIVQPRQAPNRSSASAGPAGAEVGVLPGSASA